MSRWLRLVVAVVAIAALVVTLVLVRRGSEQRAADEMAEAVASYQTERIQVLEIPRDTISSITVERPDTTLRFSSGPDGQLTPHYEHDVKWVSSRIGRIIGSVASLAAQRLIDEQPESLDEFGLGSPSARVRVTAEGSDPVTLVVGNVMPGSVGYYVQIDGEPSVYAVSASWISPFFYSLDDLRDKTLAQIDPTKITAVTVENLNGRTIQMELMPEGDTDPEMSLAGWVVTSPFVRRQSVSINWLDGILEGLPSVAIIRYEDDDPADLAAYGLDPPKAAFSISDATNSIAMELGDSVEGGRFARYPDGASVFVVSGTEPIISSIAYETISPFIYIVNIDLMDKIVVETNGERYVAELTRTPAPNPDDDPVETFYYQGQEMEEDLFRDLYQWIIGLQVDAESRNPTQGQPVMTIAYTLNTGAPPVTVEIVPYDTNYLAVYRDGYSEFLIAKSIIARLQEALADPSVIE